MVNSLSTCTLTQCVSCLYSTSSNNVQPMSPHTLTKCIPFLDTHWHNVSPRLHTYWHNYDSSPCLHTHWHNVLPVSTHIDICVSTVLTLYSVFVLSRLDYCKSLSAGCPNILTSNNRSRTMLPDSFSKPPDPSTRPSDSYASFSSLATYWVKDRMQTVFALRLSFIKPPSTFRSSSPLHSFPAAVFCRHPSVQKTKFQTKSSSQSSFSYQAPVIWNQLPVSVRRATSVSPFKSSLKTSFEKPFSLVSLPWDTCKREKEGEREGERV